MKDKVKVIFLKHILPFHVLINQWWNTHIGKKTYADSSNGNMDIPTSRCVKKIDVILSKWQLELGALP